MFRIFTKMGGSWTVSLIYEIFWNKKNHKLYYI